MLKCWNVNVRMSKFKMSKCQIFEIQNLKINRQNVEMSNCQNIEMSNFQNVRMSKWRNVRMLELQYGSVKILICLNIQMLKFWNVEMSKHKCQNVEIFKCEKSKCQNF